MPPAGALIAIVVSSLSVSVIDASETLATPAPLPETVTVSSNSSVESSVGVIENEVVLDAAPAAIVIVPGAVAV